MSRGLKVVSFGRRTARLIDIRTAICRSQPPNRAGSRSCRNFRIAWTNTSCVTSRASARCRKRDMTVAKTAVSNCCTSAPNASRLPACASITNPIVRCSSMFLGSLRDRERPDALLKPPGFSTGKALTDLPALALAIGRQPRPHRQGSTRRDLIWRAPGRKERHDMATDGFTRNVAGQAGPADLIPRPRGREEPSIRSKPKTTRRTCRPSWKALS